MHKEEHPSALLPKFSQKKLRAGLTEEDIKELGREFGLHYYGDPGYPAEPSANDPADTAEPSHKQKS